MKLSYYCDNCKQENFIKASAPTRVELQMFLGKDEIKERCKYCSHLNIKHLNRIMASPSKMISFIVGVAGILIGGFLIYLFGWLGALAFSIPAIIAAQQQKTVSTFNKTTIRRK